MFENIVRSVCFFDLSDRVSDLHEPFVHGRGRELDEVLPVPGVEAAVLADLELIRSQGAEAAYKSCL